MELFILLGAFALVAGLMVAMARLAQWVFAPLERRSRGPIPVRKFLVVDALALMTLLQFTLAATAGTLRAMEIDGGWITSWGSLAFVLTVLVWWAGVELVSRAGIADGRRRFVFLAVAVPTTFASVLAVAYGIPALMAVAPATNPWLAAVALPVLPLPYACRRLVAWVASPAPGEPIISPP